METWSANGLGRNWVPLFELPDQSLWRGDVIRLPHHPSIGPHAGPVDLLLFELWGYDRILGLMMTKGYKAGMPWIYLPPESQGTNRLSLETAWLRENWDRWFCYRDFPDELDAPVPLPKDGVLVRRNSSPAPRLKVP
ncbi:MULTISPECIES: Imm45 family immunity protein [unclassified Shinella]|uniref:Imm45 family immunity protein n=1 Tax=unclassified Shinella TaxID=2643062 RepID=UPI000A7FBAD6|nr:MULTISPECIES: Imm45 family immunity protein [unclassified Shinella]MCO5150629.1 Imm45 family immunity protein [Shinella sp.]MDC7263360.1 hypothetical protein [Shinella sp. HY16]MDC7270255.1 hypothetical protein [Shinella sp. YZ44]